MIKKLIKNFQLTKHGNEKALSFFNLLNALLSVFYAI